MTSHDEKRPTLQDLWRVAAAILGIVAVVQELRKPEDQRTWHGAVAGLVPYDFRRPTPSRLRETYWNPEGSVVSPKLWGVGWSPNFAVLKDRILALKPGH